MIIITDLTSEPEEIVDDVVCVLLLYRLVLTVRLGGGGGGGSSWCTGHHLGLLGVRLVASRLQTQSSLGVILALISISSCFLLGSLDLPLNGNLEQISLIMIR